MGNKRAARASNRLLAGLPARERAKIVGACDTVELAFGDVLHETDRAIERVYFPVVGFISLVAPLDDHPPLEMGLIGSEGMLGASVILGVKTAPMRAVVQGPGPALTMTCAHFLREVADSPALLRVVHRYLYVTMAQLMQSAACTRFHEIGPRLARWLLMTHDRAHADHFHLTHEFLAGMLGVRRSGVSIAAAVLQARKLIEYSRGEIHVLNRKGLEAASCECYGLITKHYEKVID
jgi:CRP-like cAMP-binding protein